MAELAGRYRLGEVIGTGGTSTVYRATDLSLGVERAVKVLRPDALGADAQRSRLRAEARAMARVSHPNILGVYDVGTDGEHDFVVMELARGGSLQDRLDEAGPLPITVACRYALQVLGALAAAHDAGVIHRDVKPQNVLLDEHGVALLADFGIALLGDGREARHTRVGVAMGSMAYMPPEQRLDARGVGVSADVYSAGATLYALVTGASPVDLFLAAPGSARWEDVPPPLRPVLQRATRLAPEERWESARAMAAALLGAMERLPPDAAPHPEDDRAWGNVREQVLASLAPPGADAAAPDRSRGGRPVATRVDPTMILDEPGRGRRGRWVALGVATALVVGVGVWGWETRVSPGAAGGVVTPAPAPPSAPAARPSGEGAAAATLAPTAPGSPSAEAAPTAPGPPVTGSASSAAVLAPPKAPAKRDVAPQARVAAGTAMSGAWTGSWSGRPMRIELEGPDDALTGTVTARFMGNAIVSAVRGAYDPGTRTLVLEDTEDVPDRGRYTATLVDGPALDGRFERESPYARSAFRVSRAP